MKTIVNNNQTNLEALNFINEVIKGSKFENHVYCMEGCARDFYLGEDIYSINLCVDLYNGCNEFAKFLIEKDGSLKEHNPLCYDDERYAYATLYNIKGADDAVLIEIETMEKDNESYSNKKHELASIKEHALTKAFTIDALYVNISNGDIYDPLGYAKHDINNKLIRTSINADELFEKNPEKMLNAIQSACDNNYSIEKSTWFSIIKNANKLSSNKKIDLEIEFELAATSNKFSTYLRYMLRSGLLQYIMPHVYSLTMVKKTDEYDTDMFEHTLQVIDKCPIESDIQFAALFHDTGKYQVEKTNEFGFVTHYNHEALSGRIAYETLKNLGFSDITAKRVKNIVELHGRFMNKSDVSPSLKTLKTLKSDAGDNLEAVFKLMEANNLSRNEKYQKPKQVSIARDLIEKIEKRESLLATRKILPINGKDLMDRFNLKPSQTIGVVFSKVNDAFKKNINMSKEDCFKVAENELKKLNAI